MGTWGPGIFSDDVAEDVREEYRRLVGDGVPDPEATQRVLEEFAGEEASVVWPALAATQSSLGRLEEEVKVRALRLIDDGSALAPWLGAPASDLRARKAALARLHSRLVGPQPERKKVRREWRPDTDLAAGNVLAWRRIDQLHRLLRVVAIEKARNGTWPVVEVLAGSWSEVPEPEVLNGLRAALVGSSRPLRWVAYPFHYGEPGWQKAGFALVGSIALRPGDDRARVSQHTSWPHLAERLEALANEDDSGSSAPPP